jgi:hypothetical protein
MVLRGLRFPGLVALATVLSISTAHANGSTQSPGYIAMSYGEAKPVVVRAPRPDANPPIEPAATPRLSADVAIEDPNRASVPQEDVAGNIRFMQQGGNSQIIPNQELPVILSYAEFKKLVRYEMDHRNIKIYAGRYAYLFRSSLSPVMENLRAPARAARAVSRREGGARCVRAVRGGETERRIFVHIAWSGGALINVRVSARRPDDRFLRDRHASDNEASLILVFGCYGQRGGREPHPQAESGRREILPRHFRRRHRIPRHRLLSDGTDLGFV